MVENGKGLTAIVAVSQNWGIGREGQLLFHLREDLRRFKELTMGHPVIMGRKTLQSLPGGRGLPGRRNLVLTRQPDFKAERAEAFSDVENLLAAAGEDAFVIGGAEVYRLLLPRCQRVCVTHVLAEAEADAFFPELSRDTGWQVERTWPVCTEGNLSYRYVDYCRIKRD